MGTFSIKNFFWILNKQNDSNLTFKYIAVPGQKPKTVFYRAVFTDIFKKDIFSDTQPFLADNGAVSQTCSIHFSEEIFVKNAFLRLEFLSALGVKTVLTYFFASKTKFVLKSSEDLEMDKAEQDMWWDAFEKVSSTSEVIVKEKDISSESLNIYDDSILGYPGFQKYKKAIYAEIEFLKEGGGKKHKVTNGRFIYERQAFYYYSFELESELYLNDDSPMKLIVGSETVSGFVVMCEDFQIVVCVTNKIGEKINTAYIQVEPWKILKKICDCLQEKRMSENPLTKKLIVEGPKKASDRDIAEIPKGQNKVIEHAMTKPITIVWGPPGTGKTHTMSEVAIANVKAGKRVLIVSHSNVSVDGVADRIYRLLVDKKMTSTYESGKVLRYGYIRNPEVSSNQYISSFAYTMMKNPKLQEALAILKDEYAKEKVINGIGTAKAIDLHNKIKSIHAKMASEEQELVGKASVVITTVTKVIMESFFQDRMYDVVMFDEISMAYVFQIICAAIHAKERLICVGDFMQLEPISQSPKATDLNDDLFNYLGINKNGKPFYHEWLVMLNEQRRMHKQVSKFVNINVYHGLLTDHECVNKLADSVTWLNPLNNNAVNIIDTSGCYSAAYKNDENSRFNPLSGIISFLTAVQAAEEGRRGESKVSVGIITPYAAQMRFIRSLLKDYASKIEAIDDIKCSTVHQFQGSESDVIIFDSVENYPKETPGFLMCKKPESVKRLINVAVSRARGKLITIGNTRYWRNFADKKGKGHLYYKLQDYAATSCNNVSAVNTKLKSFIDEISQQKDILVSMNINGQKYEQLYKDISKAKSEILISLPNGRIDESVKDIMIDHLLKAKEHGVSVLCKTMDYANLPELWKNISCGSDDAFFPTVIIDKKVVWYGVPTADWMFSVGTSEYHAGVKMSIRLTGEHIADMLISLANLDYSVNITNSGLITKSKLTTKKMKVLSKGGGELSKYLSSISKCTCCSNPMKLTKGKTGKYIMWCAKCKKTGLINYADINHYIVTNYVKCPEDGDYISAGLNGNGVYLKCDHGHYVDLFSI